MLNRKGYPRLKKFMKKTILLLTSAAVATGIVGCGDYDGGANSSPTTTHEATTETVSSETKAPESIFYDAAYSIGISDPSNFSYSGKSGNENYGVYLFNQEYAGYPVDGGYVQIVVDSSGNVVDISGYEKDVSAVDVENMISDDDAHDKFERYIKQTYQQSLDDIRYESEGISIIPDENGAYYPGYIFVQYNPDGSVPMRRYIFHANTGDFVSEDELYDSSGEMTTDITLQGQEVEQTLDVCKNLLDLSMGHQ